MPSPTFKAVGKTELLSQTVESAIEAAIRSGEYEVGEKLPSEMELGAQFGVSRTVMREALRMLSARGLRLRPRLTPRSSGPGPRYSASRLAGT